MKVLIIGNTGFIGRNIFQKLKVLDKTNLVGVSTKEIDLKKDESVIALSKYFSSDCIVVMCAGVKKQLGDTLITFDDNLTIIKNFCKAILLVPPKKIFCTTFRTKGRNTDSLLSLSINKLTGGVIHITLPSFTLKPT